MEWKEYKKIEREILKNVKKQLKSYKKNMLEEFKELSIGVMMNISLDLQHQVPKEKRVIAIDKMEAKEKTKSDALVSGDEQ